MSAIATELPAAIRDATRDQPAAGQALAAALESPTHAFMLTGPPGTGKRAAARAFAAELIADGAPDPSDARRRVLADPSPHPDLVWLEPPGAQHLVETVRERVIAAASYRPFEGERRAFVVAAAEAMAEESQNALLKTLEEPAPFAHIILITAEPEALLETVRSRCRPVRFAPLAPDAAARLLAERAPGSPESERMAAARLTGGDVGRAAALCTPLGRELRDVVIASARAARTGELSARPWEQLLVAAEAGGKEAGETALAAAQALTEESGETQGPSGRRRAREAEEGARRATRRARTQTLDHGLELLAAWLRDLAAVGEGAPELVLNADRAEPLAEDAEGLDPRRARRAAELVMDTRRRLTVNVNEELALEALLYRLEALLATR
ncbi:MAG: DNA polymerase III subunit delta' C-terminal domain-containing protein [Solirubrobacterales bacterium]